jgi:hypothetical protein
MNGRSIRHPRENQKPGAKLERAVDTAERGDLCHHRRWRFGAVVTHRLQPSAGVRHFVFNQSLPKTTNTTRTIRMTPMIPTPP